MNDQKIAILTDSGCDLPLSFREKHSIYQLPLSVLFKDKIYNDGVDIDPKELFSRMETEIPTTSIPQGSDVHEILQKIKADGYKKVLAISISSKLSGISNMLRVHNEHYHEMEMDVIDTKNISVGSGLVAIAAAEHIEKGLQWLDLKKQTLMDCTQSKVFFSVKSLEYLRRGGRIGLVKSLLGSVINICPIISCNNEGVYYIDAKAKGWNNSLNKLCERAEKYAAGAENIRIAIMHGNVPEEAASVKEKMLRKLPKALLVAEGQINPSLAVHTGPGIVGIGIMRC